MKDIVYSQLEKIYTDMTPEHFFEASHLAGALAARAVDYANTARKHGLLELEPSVDGKDDLFSKLVMMAIDGADPEAIEEAGITEYLSKYLGRSPEERLIALMGITGAQLLQARRNPYIIEQALCAMAPVGTEGYLDAEKDSLEQKRKESSDEEVSSEARLEDLCSRGYPDYGKEDMVEKLTDHALRQLDQTGMMRLLREVENRDIAVAMKLLSGEATKNVFDAMSHRLALMIAEDVEFMGPVRAKDIEEACVKVMKTLVKMIDAGEIVCEEGQAYKLFMQLFAAESEAAGTLQSKQQKSEKELSDLLKEFADSRNKSNRLID